MPNQPRKQDDPQVPFTAALLKGLLQRLERLETSVRMVKVSLAQQIVGKDPEAMKALFLDWQKVEDEAASSSLTELEWIEKAFQKAAHHPSTDSDS
jgi:hypothetical protein